MPHSHHHDVTAAERRILIVDEDRGVVARLRRILEKERYVVEAAFSSDAAMEAMQQFEPRVALIDIQFENDSGIGLFLRLKEVDPGLFCILITAFGEVKSAVRALEAGAFNYLLKPLDEHQLLAILEKCVETVAAERELDEARDELEKRETLYKKAIAYAHAAAYQRDYATKSFSFVDDNIYHLTGYRPEELTPEVWSSIIVDRVMQGEGTGLAVEEAIRRTWAGELRVWTADYKICTKNGEERWLADASVQLQDDSGRPIGALGFLQDITNRKKAEEDLRRLNIDLEQRVADRTAELQRINVVIQEKNAILNRTVLELSERERIMAEELTLAQEVQQHFLPRSFPFHENLRFGAYYRSCSKIGGDLYDAFPLKERVAGFYIADASGHGVSAALVSSVLKVSFERLRHVFDSRGNGDDPTPGGWTRTESLSGFMNDLNAALVDTIPGRTFVTFQLGILFLDSGRFLIANAGHSPPLRFQKDSRSVEELEVPSNLPLGLHSDWNYEIQEYHLQSGDKLLVYTDGITEAENAHQEEFGLDRLVEVILENGHLSPEPLIDRLVTRMNRFMGECEPHDDQSILVIDFEHASENSNTD